MKFFSLLPTLVFAVRVIAFPSHASLAGLSERELEAIIPTLEAREPAVPPGPLEDDSPKLVNDEAHPWKPLRPGDIRGPCPGLNTLASHGYLPRNGVTTPAQMVAAAMEGFNMANGAALFATYAAHLMDGNPITDLLSIGRKTVFTGPDPPSPAIVGGLNNHGTFEGDASMTRGDAFFGSNHDFNETLFQQLIDYSNQFGGGKFNVTVAAELRFKRIQDSIATNPNFTFVGFRYFTAYGETVAPVNLFVDGRQDDGQLDMDAARGFFQFSRMPDGFFRANGPKGNEGRDEVIRAHPVQPGRNVGRVNSYTVDPTSPDFSTPCLLYENLVNVTVKGLYPNPKGKLRKALNTNLDFFFQAISGAGCTQVFPYGRD
ncbi:heme-thiolate peroxidase [Agrocybe chaxingu]|uniref:Heme-thiolate peroxidase n=1 Tax=Agrocybe chaxingu TaxID=84603 RepID=A0A9W8MXR5_9AGAR|nr:heme-thiolate peroxidase [Agrocybe chaxingu]